MAEAVKFDGDKLRFDLIPAEELEELARVYTIGANKYSDRNWELGMSWGRVFAAMCRHSWKWWRGEIYDPVDGQHHLSSVAWCAFALMNYERRKVGTDDRPQSKDARVPGVVNPDDGERAEDGSPSELFNFPIESR